MRVLSMRGGHDASVSIINEGKLELFLKEERYSGVKRDCNLNYCWGGLIASKSLTNLDYAVLQTTDGDQLSFFGRQLLIFSPDVKIISTLEEGKLELGRHHHLFHASNSFYSSGFDDALVVVVDSSGGYLGPLSNPSMYENQSVYHMNYDKCVSLYKGYKTPGVSNRKPIAKGVGKRDIEVSFGWEGIGIGDLYNTAPLVMGQSVQDCGKAMGLASYGKSVDKLSNLFDSGNFNKVIDYFKDVNPLLSDFFTFKSESSIPTYITEENCTIYADYCYEVQTQTSNKMCEIVDTYIKKTGIKNVCIGGGYGMNIVNNYNLIRKFPEVNFYFDSLCEDTGLSLGIAKFVYRKLSKDKKVCVNDNISFHGLNHDVTPYIGHKASIKNICAALMQDKSVGVFYGQAEAGQRALGNRSILFNALNCNAKDIVNKIKKREWYRPFAAMVLEEDAHLYFENVIPSPEMTLCFPVKSEYAIIIAGVTHVDDTSRVQTIGSDHFLYELLTEFKKLSGHGILLNTSLNLAGDPLVETPKQAIDMLNESSLDYLWFFETKQLFKSTF